MKYNFVDYNYFSEYQISLIAGRPFMQDVSTDEQDAFVVNEAAVKAFCWSNSETALGKRNQGLGKIPKHLREIAGVVSDFH